MCFQVDNKSPHAAQCVKSRVLKKVIDSILSINTFEQKCVVIKCLLQSSRLEDHMKTIGIDQSSFAKSSFEHICMNNIKKIYQHAGKCDPLVWHHWSLLYLFYLSSYQKQHNFPHLVNNICVSKLTTRKSYIMYNYFKPTCYVASLST